MKKMFLLIIIICAINIILMLIEITKNIIKNKKTVKSQIIYINKILLEKIVCWRLSFLNLTENTLIK